MKRIVGDRWIALEVKLADMWIGCYWEYRKTDYGTASGYVVEEFHCWVCIVPCFPIHYIAASKYAARQP
jgi:hypothetical protein